MLGIRAIFRLKMAVAAGWFPVSSGKFEIRFGMIEPLDPIPLACIVAYPAIRTGVKFRSDMVLMDIFMTIGAKLPDVPETPTVFFFVALKAGRCKVGVPQYEFRLIVPVDRK